MKIKITRRQDLSKNTEWISKSKSVFLENRTPSSLDLMLESVRVKVPAMESAGDVLLDNISGPSGSLGRPAQPLSDIANLLDRLFDALSAGRLLPDGTDGIDDSLSSKGVFIADEDAETAFLHSHTDVDLISEEGEAGNGSEFVDGLTDARVATVRNEDIDERENLLRVVEALADEETVRIGNLFLCNQLLDVFNFMIGAELQITQVGVSSSLNNIFTP